MYTEARKIHLIEEVLKVNDQNTLAELEGVLKKSKKEKKLNIYDFVGIFTKKEGNEMRKAIKETCENIHPDDWK